MFLCSNISACTDFGKLSASLKNNSACTLICGDIPRQMVCFCFSSVISN